MDKNQKKYFSVILKKIMRDKNLNQLTLAKIIDIKQGQISDWINNRNFPGYLSLIKICRKLEIDANVLLGLIKD